MARLDDRLAALAALPPAGLRDAWARVLGSVAPAAFSRDLLLRELAYRAQEQAHGSLPMTTRRRLDELAQAHAAGRALRLAPRPVIKAGTRLARDWHGRTHHVLVLDGGYLYDDRRYTSLSRIAREITGAAWSGPRFFGLKAPARPFAAAADVEKAHG